MGTQHHSGNHEARPDGAAVSPDTESLDARLGRIVTLADILLYAVEHVGQTLDNDSVLDAARRIQREAHELRNHDAAPPAPATGESSPQPTWQPAPIIDNDAWGWLYEVDSLLAVLRRALHSEESTIEDGEAHECEALIKSARLKLGEAMGALEEWSYAQAGRPGAPAPAIGESSPIEMTDEIVGVEFADGSTIDVTGRNLRLASRPGSIDNSHALFDNHYQLFQGIVVTARRLWKDVNEPEPGEPINEPAAEMSCALACLVDQLAAAMKSGEA